MEEGGWMKGGVDGRPLSRTVIKTAVTFSSSFFLVLCFSSSLLTVSACMGVCSLGWLTTNFNSPLVQPKGFICINHKLITVEHTYLLRSDHKMGTLVSHSKLKPLLANQKSY